MHRQVSHFETKLTPRGFVLNVLSSLTWSNLTDPDTEIKELLSKYDLDFCTRVTDIVLKYLAKTVVTHAAMNSALSKYVKNLELKQLAADL